MTILTSDIKLYASERMTDAADGGGRMTSSEIPDAVIGNIFPKISRMDTVNGRVNLRQIFGSVRSNNADTYAGAHAVVMTPPTNDRIGILLFSTGNHSAVRSDLRNWIESYVVGGPLSRLRLYGNQTQGQRSILCYQRTEEPLPDVGQVFMLSVEAAGYPAATQFVRVDEVTHEVRTFTDSSGDFDRRLVMLKLTSALQQTFVGAEPSRYSTDPAPTKVRNTQVADSARYYGITRLAAPMALGAIAAQVESIYAPLVPSSERETPISLVEPTGAYGWVATGDPITTAWGYIEKGQTKTYRSPTQILPGSWSLNSFNIKDDGAGNITGDYGTTGTIDYEASSITMTYGPSYPGTTYGSLNQTYTPAILAQSRAHTKHIPITLATRGTVYTLTLAPLPAVGSVVVEYQAMGKWYRLRDNRQGGLVGNGTGEGTGSIAYSSGALVVTLGALPDVGSSVIVSWGSPAHYTKRAGATTANSSIRAELRFFLTNLPVKPGSVTLRWRDSPSASESTITDSAGVLVGNSGGPANYPGSINYVTGEVVIPVATNPYSRARPGLDTFITAEYQQELPTGDTPLITTVTASITTPSAFNVGTTNIAPKSVRITFPITYAPYPWSTPQVANVTVVDNGAGSLVTLFGSSGTDWTTRAWWAAGQACGTINYTTGDVTLSSLMFNSMIWTNSQSIWYPSTTSKTADVGDFIITTKALATTYAARSESVSVGEQGYLYDLTANTTDAVIPGSVYLDFLSFKIFDRSGNLYYAFDPATGQGTLCGTIDYGSGVARLTSLPSGQSMDTTATPVKACLTTHGDFSAIDVAFRTAGSPIRPASMYVQAVALDGAVCSGTADVNGNITGAHIRGIVHAPSGVCYVEFGDTVGAEWVPRDVWPATIRYSCVVVSNLPLDPSIIGLDPLRLPSDGRVPMVRPGDMCVIHETGTVSIAAGGALPGATISSGRSSRTISGGALGEDVIIPATTLLELRDKTGLRVSESLYTPDLVAGTITFATPLDLSAYTFPLTLYHGIEDMALISDAQINGSVAILSPTLYAYTDQAYLSTALPFGDVAARVEHVFDQQSWTNVWSDSLIGSEAAGQLNTLQYPVEVKNNGCEKQRWRAQVTSVSPLTVQIHGEDLGLIGTFNATADISPVNPLTGQPYFTIRASAWGGAASWSVGNQVRFNTVSSACQIDIARTVLAGAARTGDSFYVAFRGDID